CNPSQQIHDPPILVDPKTPDQLGLLNVILKPVLEEDIEAGVAREFDVSRSVRTRVYTVALVVWELVDASQWPSEPFVPVVEVRVGASVTKSPDVVRTPKLGIGQMLVSQSLANTNNPAVLVALGSLMAAGLYVQARVVSFKATVNLLVVGLKEILTLI
ncbi:MAG: hypothetical protein OK457_06560, partial [Thaumarchaeota archaeon]|nr:hypothetical protein [Nitrososphaerota archaeon]